MSDFTQKLLNAGLNVVKPDIIEALPHDKKAFTQGLAFSQGILYESTGTTNASSIRRLNSNTGEVELLKPLPNHWGEGLAIQGESIVQLTWRSKTAIVYRLADFSKQNEWYFNGEGWGLAAFGEGYVMTNGSGDLQFRNQKFELTKRVTIRRKGLPIKWLNDLEFARERFLIHRLGDTNLYEVESKNYSIVRIIDASELIQLANPQGKEDVLNGIAYDTSSNAFFMTGKRWPLLFKIKIPL